MRGMSTATQEHAHKRTANAKRSEPPAGSLDRPAGPALGTARQNDGLFSITGNALVQSYAP
jgi:hypothetical protein